MSGSFISGSHAYGTPTPESDVDVVIPCEPEVAEAIVTLLLGADECAAIAAGNHLAIVSPCSPEDHQGITAAQLDNVRPWPGTAMVIGECKRCQSSFMVEPERKAA